MTIATATTTAVVATAVTAAVSTSDVQPSASNTGVTAGVTLTNVTSLKAASNTTYMNLHITGQVSLTNLTNVKFINCVIDAAGSSYDVKCTGATNITIQNCELLNAASAGIYGDGYTAIGNYVHRSGGDAFKAGKNVVIQGNYVTELGWNQPSAHADGVQIRNGDNVVITGNFFDMPNDVANTKSNSALFVQLNTTNITFTSNWVRGGNYSIHAYSDLAGGNATIQIINNVFYSGSARYGFGSVGTGVIWTGNVTNAGVLATAKMK